MIYDVDDKRKNKFEKQHKYFKFESRCINSFKYNISKNYYF